MVNNRKIELAKAAARGVYILPRGFFFCHKSAIMPPRGAPTRPINPKPPMRAPALATERPLARITKAGPQAMKAMVMASCMAYPIYTHLRVGILKREPRLAKNFFFCPDSSTSVTVL